MHLPDCLVVRTTLPPDSFVCPRTSRRFLFLLKHIRGFSVNFRLSDSFICKMSQLSLTILLMSGNRLSYVTTSGIRRSSLRSLYVNKDSRSFSAALLISSAVFPRSYPRLDRSSSNFDAASQKSVLFVQIRRSLSACPYAMDSYIYIYTANEFQ